MAQDFRWGYIDETGQVVIPFQFDSANPFSNGLAKVWQAGTWSLIDRTGQYLVGPV